MAQKKKILHCFKRRHCEKALSRTNSLFTFSAVVVLPSDCILSFLFPAETDVLVPVLSRSTDVVVVNLVVVLKYPNVSLPTGRFPCNLSSFGRRECYEKYCKMVLEFHSRNSSKFTGKNYSLNNGSPFILHPPRPFLPFYSHNLHENQDHR